MLNSENVQDTYFSFFKLFMEQKKSPKLNDSLRNEKLFLQMSLCAAFAFQVAQAQFST